MEDQVGIILEFKADKKHSVQYQEKSSNSPYPYAVYIPKTILGQLGDPTGDIEVIFKPVKS